MACTPAFRQASSCPAASPGALHCLAGSIHLHPLPPQVRNLQLGTAHVEGYRHAVKVGRRTQPLYCCATGRAAPALGCPACFAVPSFACTHLLRSPARPHRRCCPLFAPGPDPSRRRTGWTKSPTTCPAYQWRRRRCERQSRTVLTHGCGGGGGTGCSWVGVPWAACAWRTCSRHVHSGSV